MSKMKIGIIYGGRSGEHEVSLRSASSVLKNLDRNQFEPYPIYIDKKGTWHWIDLTSNQDGPLKADLQAPEVILLPRPNRLNGAPKAILSFQDPAQFGRKEEVDLLIPMVHGTNCEDGTLQGLFESAEVPYVGSGVLASAICMDKEVAKRLAEFAGIPVVPYRVAHTWDSATKLQILLTDVEKNFGFPVFIKAAGQGSSLGVFKVKTRDQFMSTLQNTFQYDIKVLIEKAIPAREIEFSVLENPNPAEPPLVSKPAEIIPTQEFYTYEAKYHDDNGAIFKIPAEIPDELKEKLTQLVQKIFTTLECEGYARVDLFLDRENSLYYFNEVNSLPGFTSISMFPKMWEVSGIAYTDLLTKLIDLSLLRYKRRSKILKELPQN